MTVENTGAGAGLYGPLTDTPKFSPSLQVTGASWTSTSAGAAPNSAVTGNGPFTLAPGQTAIAGKATHVYTVTVSFKYKTPLAVADECEPNTPGHGLFNEVAIPGEDGTVDDNDDCVNPPKPFINIKKVAVADSVEGPAPSGDYTVSYDVTVTNSGPGVGVYGPLTDTPEFAANLHPTGISWTSSGAGAAPDGTANGAGPYALAPGQTVIGSGITHTYKVTVTFHYTDLVQAVDCVDGEPKNGLFNSVRIPGEDGPVADNDDCVPPPNPPKPSIDLVKTADKSKLVAGETITYTFVATNTGDVTLDDVKITDRVAQFTGAGQIGQLTCDKDAPVSLLPGGKLTCTAKYVVQQADVDQAQIRNVGDVVGTPPVGPDVKDDDPEDVPSIHEPAIDLVKTADKTKLVKGETITYTFVATNTGNVTLHNVLITDRVSEFTGAGTIGAITCDKTAPVSLAPGAKLTCKAPYVVQQADVDAGAIHNVGDVVGTPPSTPENPNPTDVKDDDPEDVPSVSEPAIELVKSADKTKLVKGETITYTFVATNTGNVTLSDVKIAEQSFDGAGQVSALDCTPAQPAKLAPGDKLTCTATYAVQQADVDAGKINNVADVTGNPPKGDPVTDKDDESVPGDSKPGLSLDKQVGSITDVNGNAKTDVGDKINYVFVVTNTGNVTMKDVSVTDVLVAPAGPAVSVTCPKTVLAPGEATTCTASPYTVTSDDLDAGSVQNTATATGNPPSGGPVTTPPDSTITPLVQEPAMTMDKRVSKLVDVNHNSATDTGDEIWYAFEVSNIGNTTLTDVRIDDPMLTKAGIGTTCTPTTIKPGGSADCKADEAYVITKSDVAKGHVRNIAVGLGQPADCASLEASPKQSDKRATGACQVQSEADSVNTPADESVVDTLGTNEVALPETGAPTGMYQIAGLGGVLVLLGFVMVRRNRREATRR